MKVQASCPDQRRALPSHLSATLTIPLRRFGFAPPLMEDFHTSTFPLQIACPAMVRTDRGIGSPIRCTGLTAISLSSLPAGERFSLPPFLIAQSLRECSIPWEIQN